MDVEVFIWAEYMEDAPEVMESAKLVMDGLTILDKVFGLDSILFGEGKGLSFSESFLSLGFEKSFIFDLSDFSLCSFSGGWKLVSPGDNCGLRGIAALAAVAAAIECPPTAPL